MQILVKRSTIVAAIDSLTKSNLALRQALRLSAAATTAFSDEAEVRNGARASLEALL